MLAASGRPAEAVPGGAGHGDGVEKPQVRVRFREREGDPTRVPLVVLEGGRPHRRGGITLALPQC